MNGRAVGLLFGLGVVGFFAALALQAGAKSTEADKNAAEASIAKRVADAIATRNPTVMRSLAAQLDKENQPQAAEGLRMAADLAEAAVFPQGMPMGGTRT